MRTRRSFLKALSAVIAAPAVAVAVGAMKVESKPPIEEGQKREYPAITIDAPQMTALGYGRGHGSRLKNPRFEWK